MNIYKKIEYLYFNFNVFEISIFSIVNQISKFDFTIWEINGENEWEGPFLTCLSSKKYMNIWKIYELYFFKMNNGWGIFEKHTSFFLLNSVNIFAYKTCAVVFY